MFSNNSFHELSSLSLKYDVKSYFACIWSEDDTVAVLTDTAVHVLTLKPDMKFNFSEICFCRNLIEPKAELPRNITGYDPIKIINRLTTIADKNDMIMKGLVTDQPRESWDIQIAWSPAEVLNQCECLLAVLSNSGCIDVYMAMKRNWKSVVDISEIWINHVKEIWSNEMLETDLKKQAQAHEKRIDQVTATSVAWSELYDNKQYSFIAISFKSGTITLWKFKTLSSRSENPQIELVFEFCASSSEIHSLDWHKSGSDSGILTISTHCGEVKSLFFEDLTKNEPKVENELVLWPAEIPVDISVRYVKSYKLNDKKLVVLASKGCFLVVFVIDIEKKTHSKRICNFEAFNISGIENLSQQEFMIITEIGYIFKIEIQLKKDEFVVTEKRINCDINREILAVNGICHSRNKVIWLVATSPCTEFDRLTLRKSTHLMHLSYVACADNILLENPSKALTNYWDCLESIRLQILKNSDYSTAWFPSFENVLKATLYELRIYMCVSQAFEAALSKKRNITKVEEFVSSRACKKIIKKKHAMNYLEQLIECHNKGTLNSLQLSSVRYLCCYLEECAKIETFETADNPDINLNINILLERAKTVELNPPEECQLCGKEMLDLQCPDNHPEQRCLISFVQIPFDKKYLVCKRCNSFAHPDIGDGLVFCIYCDLPMIEVM